MGDLVLAEAVVADSVVVAGPGHSRLHQREVVIITEGGETGVVVEEAHGVLGEAVEGPLPRLAHHTPLLLVARILAMLEQNQQVPRTFDCQL